MGEAHITLEDGTQRSAACMGGMLSMFGGECRLLTTTFEWADSIDKERAERSKARAEELLAQKNLDARELELCPGPLETCFGAQQCCCACSVLIDPLPAE